MKNYPRTNRLVVLVLLVFFNTHLSVSGAELRGRVTDAATGASLSGALVTLDPNAAVQDDEVTTRTDPFGFYYALSLPAGTYEVTASHPGYTPGTKEQELTDSDLLMEDFALNPLVPGQTLITIFGQVVDTKSSLELPGVPVRIRRFNSENASAPAETFVQSTNVKGVVEFRGMPTGWYDFRFNVTENDTDQALSRWEPLAIGRRLLTTSHSANARLMPIGQDITIRIDGPDPCVLPIMEGGLGGVYVTLTGIRPDFDKNLPDGFDPFSDLLSDYVIPVLPPRSGVTNSSGAVVFKNLPAIPFLVEVQKYGYKKWEEPYVPDDNGDFESPRTYLIDLEPTDLQISLESIFPDPIFVDGVPIVIQGLKGTNTECIRREAPAFGVPEGGGGGGGFGGGLEPATAFFERLLPGRYLISVNHRKASPLVIAADFAETTYGIAFEGEKYIDVNVGVLNSEVLELRVIPATIRGKIWAADEVGGLETGESAFGSESPLYLGPIYKPMEQGGIEFTESDAVVHLPPGLTVVSVDADKDGNFIAQVLPGVYGVNIPSMDGYWGSNYNLLNRADGESFSLGWPYTADPFLPPPAPPIPIPPFGSAGIIINSGGDYELDLFVRKQLWYLSAEVTADIMDHPALNRIMTNVPDPSVTAFFSDLGEGGSMTVDLEGGGSIVKPLEARVSGAIGTGRIPHYSGVFDFTLPPGLHKLSGSHPNHTIEHPGTGETEFDVLLPDLGYPGLVVDEVVLPLTQVWGGLPDLPDFLKAEYSGTTTLKITMFSTNEDDERSEVISFTKPDVFTFPGQGSKQFAVTPEPFKMVPGDWTVWKEFGGTWYGLSFTIGELEFIKEIEFDIIEGPGSPPPELKYALSVEAVSDADPKHKIPGLEVEFFDGKKATTPFSSGAYDGGYLPSKISPTTKWLPAIGIPPGIASYDVKFDFASGTPKIDVTMRMLRGMSVKGTVKAKKDEETLVMEKVTVHVRNRYGNLLTTAITNDKGEFEIDPALTNAQTIFLEVNTPGYFPFRKRIMPNNLGEDATPVDIDEAIELTLLPGPLSVTGTFNRFGPFLPGVSKSSSGGVLSPDTDLDMSYDITAMENEFTVSLQPYDLPDGTAAEVEEVELKDPVKEIWIVDPRGFAKDPYGDDPMPLMPPEADALFNLKMHRYVIAAMRRTFMEPIEPGVLPVQWHRRFSAMPTETEGEAKAMGKVSLSTLPAGEFQPLIIAASQRGAYSYTQVKFDGFDSNKNLNGVRLPPWAATIADVLGTATAVKEAGSNVNWDNFIPEGYISPLPDISADIEVSEGGFMKYTYAIGVNLAEGVELPGSGMGAFMPGFGGLDVNGTATLEIDGGATSKSGLNVGSFSLEGKIVATTDALDITDYIPLSLPKNLRKKVAAALKDDVSVSLIAGGSATLKTSEDTINGKPLERKIKTTTSAGVSVPVSINLNPIIHTIPTVGPVVLALQRTPVNPEFFANISNGIGTTISREWSTQYPHIVKAGNGGSVVSLTPEDSNHTRRRHYLGGAQETLGTKFKLERAICVRFGVGLEASIASGRLGASGTLSLTGNECLIPTGVGGGEQPALKITLNQFGDWPPVTRIQGGVKGEIEAYLDAWVARFSKSWEFNLITIDIPFNSEASFDLSPMSITETVFALDTSVAAEYLGEPPTLVQELFLPGQVAVSGIGDTVMVFTDVDPNTGEMVLRVANRTSTHTWGAIGELARAGGVVEVDVLALPSGGWMTVWTEITSEDSMSMTPPTTLMFATSTDGINWTSPASVSTLGGVASDFRLVPMVGDDVGLIFMETDRGPSSNQFDLNTVLFDGTVWGDVQTQFPDVVIRDWDAAGPGETGTDDAQIGVITDDGKLLVVTWDGTDSTGPLELVSANALPPIELGCGPDGFFSMAYAVSGGGIGFFTKASGEAWVDRGIIYEGVTPGSLAVVDMFDGVDYAYLISWTEGASGNVYYGYVDDEGTVLVDGINLTQNVSGTYANLMGTPRGDSHDASLFAFFDNGETTEIRTFDVGRFGGSINNDRDADSMDDLAEMRIMDFDTTDAIETVDDVLSGDDFDNDGFSNKEEIDAGTDPTNPGNFPGQSIKLSTQVADCFEFGTVSGQVAIVRSGDGASELTVKYSVTGTATNGSDYDELTGEVTLAPGIYVQMVSIDPVGDTLAEGNETVVITLLDDAAYSMGAETESTVTIQDLPMDIWRLAHFTEAELLDDSITGDASDADRNSLILLMEYAFGITPNSHSNNNIPYSVVLVNSTTSLPHAGMIYLRPTDAIELEYSIEVTDDLGNWLAGPDQIEIVSITDNGDGTETVVARDLTPIGDTGRFLRLNVIRNSE